MFVRVGFLDPQLAIVYSTILRVYITIVCLPFVVMFSHFAVPTAVTALNTERIFGTSLRVTWCLPEVLNGILVYYDVNVSSTSVGYFETWRIQADDPLELNISGLGIVLIASRFLGMSLKQTIFHFYILVISVI